VQLLGESQRECARKIRSVIQEHNFLEPMLGTNAKGDMQH
jgi:hypothetical protein